MSLIARGTEDFNRKALGLGIEAAGEALKTKAELEIMKILLTNDDGVFSKGIEVLFLALSEEHEVTIVAPETEQSAVGHAITWLDPLRVNMVNRNGQFFGYALKGTPADCVKIAISELMDPPRGLLYQESTSGRTWG